MQKAGKKTNLGGALLFSITLLFFSCTNRKAQIIDFLNEHEQKFDKNKVEIISLIPVDTIYQDEKYLLRNSRLNSNEGDSRFVDTLGIDTTFADVPTFNRDASVYSKALFEFITAASYVDEFDIPNKFLNGLEKRDYKKFKKQILTDYKFRQNLISQMRDYSYFTGPFSPDSAANYLNLEKLDSKRVLAYTYRFKFRYDHSLKQKLIVFDKDDKSILYYESF
jgi:hypothetical protein